MTQTTTTISQRPNATPLTGGEFLPMDQGSSTVKATAQQIANLAPGTNITYDPASRTLVSSTGDDVTLPLVSETAAGLVPDGWITGAIPAPLPHIHGALAGPVYEHVRNVSGAPMAAMTPYHVVDSQGATDRVDIIPANASDPASMPASGILMTALGTNGSAADGHGVVAGVPTGLNTAANPSGTVLYVGNGVLTPTAPAANVQALAIVGRSHANTGTLSMIGGASLARVAYTGAYGDLTGKPTIPSTPGEVGAATAAQGAKADTAVQPAALAGYVQTSDGRLSDAREWIAATIEQVEAEAGTATTRRAWTAQRVRQAAASWWATVASGYVQTTDGRLSDAREWIAATVDQVEAETGTATTRRAWTSQRVRQAAAAWWTSTRTAPGAIGGTTPDTGQFTGIGIGGATPRAGYAAAVGAGVFSRAQVVTAVGSTYSCDIRTGTRFILSAAIAGNTTIQFTNVADLQVGSGFVEYVEVEVDFRYTSGVITISAAGFTATWDGNTAATPTSGEIETLIVRITPAIAGTPFSTATVYVAPMRGRT